jgi:rRNA maturation RNase YbeY
MSILYLAEEIKLPPIKKRIVTAWIKSIAASYNKEIEDVSYIFCSDEKILEVNKEYLEHDYYTDIITFDYSEGDTISGDIFISIDTVKSNSLQFNTPYLEEIHRVIIHGILHLCGINDKTPEERAYMTECENKALEKLKSFMS